MNDDHAGPSFLPLVVPVVGALECGPGDLQHRRHALPLGERLIRLRLEPALDLLPLGEDVGRKLRVEPDPDLGQALALIAAPRRLAGLREPHLQDQLVDRQLEGRLQPSLLMLAGRDLHDLPDLRPAERPSPEGVVDCGKVHEGLSRRQQVAGLAAAHAEAVRGIPGRGPVAGHLVELAGVDLLEIEGARPVLEPGGDVGEAETLLDLVEGKALLENQRVRKPLRPLL